jgi:hypothetical protein
MRRVAVVVGLAGIAVLGAVWLWSFLAGDDPYDLASTDRAERARQAAGEQVDGEIARLLGDREPLATSVEDSCAVEDEENNESWSFSEPQIVRCTYASAVVVPLAAAADEEAVRLTQDLLGDRCTVSPHAAAVGGQIPCAGALWYGLFAVDAPGTATELSVRPHGAGGHLLRGGSAFDGAGLVERAGEAGIGYLLLLQTGTEYLDVDVDPETPAPAVRTDRPCQEHSGGDNRCPGD